MLINKNPEDSKVKGLSQVELQPYSPSQKSQ